MVLQTTELTIRKTISNKKRRSRIMEVVIGLRTTEPCRTTITPVKQNVLLYSPNSFYPMSPTIKGTWKEPCESISLHNLFSAGNPFVQICKNIYLSHEPSIIPPQLLPLRLQTYRTHSPKLRLSLVRNICAASKTVVPLSNWGVPRLDPNQR